MAATTKRDFYETLGVPKSASADDIKRAYRTLARKHHPDVDKSTGAAEKFKEISEAYQVLSDPEKRQTYDQFRRVVNSFLGQIATSATCPTCRGSGQKIDKPCHKCRGAGVVKDTVRQEIHIPAGIQDGDTVRFQGSGDDGKQGQSAGDLYL